LPCGLFEGLQTVDFVDALTAPESLLLSRQTIKKAHNRKESCRLAGFFCLLR